MKNNDKELKVKTLDFIFNDCIIAWCLWSSQSNGIFSFQKQSLCYCGYCVCVSDCTDTNH